MCHSLAGCLMSLNKDINHVLIFLLSTDNGRKNECQYFPKIHRGFESPVRSMIFLKNLATIKTLFPTFLRLRRLSGSFSPSTPALLERKVLTLSFAQFNLVFSLSSRSLFTRPVRILRPSYPHPESNSPVMKSNLGVLSISSSVG